MDLIPLFLIKNSMKNHNQTNKKQRSSPVHEDVTVFSKRFPAKKTRFQEVGLVEMIFTSHMMDHA
jgi:hypothetical protein